MAKDKLEKIDFTAAKKMRFGDKLAARRPAEGVGGGEGGEK